MDIRDARYPVPHADGRHHLIRGPDDKFLAAEGNDAVQITVRQNFPCRLRRIHLARDEPDVPAGVPELAEKALQLALQLRRVEEQIAAQRVRNVSVIWEFSFLDRYCFKSVENVFRKIEFRKLVSMQK